MNLSLLDWIVVGAYLVGTVAIGVSMRRFVGKVEHFIVAGRRMDVYLGVASLAATEFGLVTVMYTAQAGYTAGFAGAMPGVLMALAMLVVGLTGFCITPLRDSGVMTLPELFERRFGPQVRWLAGLVIVLGGLLNMGLFLRLGGQFLVHITGVPAENAETALVITMSALLALVLLYTVLGGMLSVLVTDYLQFLFLGAGLVLVTCLVVYTVGWTGLVETVQHHYGDGGFNALINANQGGTWLAWQAVQQLAVVLTWQTTVARVLAAKSSAAARSIYTRTSFYFVGRFLLPGIWGIGALAVLGPQFLASDSLNAMPAFLATLIPAGLLGFVIAAMLAAEMSTDSSYMLTWSSVIYNDLIVPLRRTPFSERTGIAVNRAIVSCIGVFLLVYGLWIQLPGSAWDYLSITGSIYLSSISVLLIACLYWPRANRYGALAAIVLGAITPLGFLLATVALKLDLPPALQGPAISGLAAYGLAALGMIVGSLATQGRK